MRDLNQEQEPPTLPSSLIFATKPKDAIKDK